METVKVVDIGLKIKSQYISSNCGGYVNRVGYRSQETIYSSYSNGGTIVDVEGRDEYRSHTSHYYSCNQGERVILLVFIGDTVVADGRVGYRYQTSHYSSQRGDSRGDGTRHGSSSEYIYHSSFSMLDKVLMELGEVDLGLGLYFITPIIQVIMVDHLFF